jgi:hypothetical protein
MRQAPAWHAEERWPERRGQSSCPPGMRYEVEIWWPERFGSGVAGERIPGVHRPAHKMFVSCHHSLKAAVASARKSVPGRRHRVLVVDRETGKVAEFYSSAEKTASFMGRKAR